VRQINSFRLAKKVLSRRGASADMLATDEREQTVRKIIEEVAKRGDAALRDYTEEFDGVKLSSLEVPDEAAKAATKIVDAGLLSALKLAANRVQVYHLKQKYSLLEESTGEGLGWTIQPLEMVGIHTPGFTAPLPSSLIMTAIPAKVAGVNEVIVTTPPGRDGSVSPIILAAADIAGVDRIFTVGGAQAIAALAFGTKSIPAVDKVIGPGNVYVTEAKRQVFGYVGVDMLAGPTEIVIIANRYSDPKLIIADLKAQREHNKAQVFLVTNSKALARQVKSQIEGNGYIILTKNLDQAVEVANRIAPEHLEILVKRPVSLVKKIRNAGAIFLGPFSPVAVGDYFAGPSHVLPTGGSARFFSGLNLSDFIKSNHIIAYSKRALEKARQPLEKIVGIEGLSQHAESVKARFQ